MLYYSNAFILFTSYPSTYTMVRIATAGGLLLSVPYNTYIAHVQEIPAQELGIHQRESGIHQHESETS